MKGFLEQLERLGRYPGRLTKLVNRLETKCSKEPLVAKQIQELRNRILDQKNKSCKRQDVRPDLNFSDIRGGNVLIDESGSIFIVAWADPIMAPKERDLMFIGGGVANIWNNPREEEFFYKGYGKTAIDRLIQAYYRHERIVEDIADYGQALILKTAGREDRLEMYKQFIDMYEPNGVVDIAFKTGEGLSI